MQKGRVPPASLTNPNAAAAAGAQRLCSFDGDADRLVYHYFQPKTGTVTSAHTHEEALSCFFFANAVLVVLCTWCMYIYNKAFSCPAHSLV